MIAETAQDNQLLRRFRDKVPYRPRCPECGTKIFRKAVESTLEEHGVLEQANTVTELTLIECPECGSAIDISGEK